MRGEQRSPAPARCPPSPHPTTLGASWVGDKDGTLRVCGREGVAGVKSQPPSLMALGRCPPPSHKSAQPGAFRARGTKSHVKLWKCFMERAMGCGEKVMGCRDRGMGCGDKAMAHGDRVMAHEARAGVGTGLGTGRAGHVPIHPHAPQVQGDFISDPSQVFIASKALSVPPIPPKLLPHPVNPGRAPGLGSAGGSSRGARHGAARTHGAVC